MVFWNSGQIDECGWKVKELVEDILRELGKPLSDFLLIVQDGNCQHPIFRLRTPFGDRKGKVSLLLIETVSTAELRSRLKRTIQTMYGRPPAVWLQAMPGTRRFHRQS